MRLTRGYEFWTMCDVVTDHGSGRAAGRISLTFTTANNRRQPRRAWHTPLFLRETAERYGLGSPWSYAALSEARWPK